MILLSTRWLAFLTLAIGGGSLAFLAYFLSFGTPFPIVLAQSDAGRLAVDSLLCLIFFVQHSGMVRRGAKRRIARYFPAHYDAALYSIASGVVLFVLILLWQPTAEVVFRIEGPARWVASAISLAAIAGFVWGVRALGEFDPFGRLALKAASRGAAAPASAFVARGPYRYVRHPLYLFVLILLWTDSLVTLDRLLFNVLWSVWIVIGTKLEERDLISDFGQTYREYQRSVPMLLPGPRSVRRDRPAVTVRTLGSGDEP